MRVPTRPVKYPSFFGSARLTCFPSPPLPPPTHTHKRERITSKSKSFVPNPTPTTGLNDKGANTNWFAQSSHYQSVIHLLHRLTFPVLYQTRSDLFCIFLFVCSLSCQYDYNLFRTVDLHVFIPAKYQHYQPQGRSSTRSHGFYLCLAVKKKKVLFFGPNTLIIAHDFRGCIFGDTGGEGIGGGGGGGGGRRRRQKIKSEEITAGIKVAVDKVAWQCGLNVNALNVADACHPDSCPPLCDQSPDTLSKTYLIISPASSTGHFGLVIVQHLQKTTTTKKTKTVKLTVFGWIVRSDWLLKPLPFSITY